MTEVTDLRDLLATIDPVLVEGEYVFCSFPGLGYGSLADLEPVFAFRESEGLTLVIPKGVADRAKIDYELTFAMISLRVYSSLSAVGLTAAIAARLASRGIAANVVSAFNHDHLFVPGGRGEEALGLLVDLPRSGHDDRAPTLPANLPRCAHLWFGLAVLLTFLGTGMYMRMGLGGIERLDSATRVMWRSRHIYILSSSLVHLALGSYLSVARSGLPRALQLAGSTMLFGASIFLIVAFFREPQTGLVSTPFSRDGIIMMLAGTLSHGLASRLGAWRTFSLDTHREG